MQVAFQRARSTLFMSPFSHLFRVLVMSKQNFDGTCVHRCFTTCMRCSLLLLKYFVSLPNDFDKDMYVRIVTLSFNITCAMYSDKIKFNWLFGL